MPDSRIFKFSPKAPPIGWQTAHTRALWETTHVSGHGALGVLTRNRAVPRYASCDYYAQDQDPRNFYFY